MVGMYVGGWSGWGGWTRECARGTAGWEPLLANSKAHSCCVPWGPPYAPQPPCTLRRPHHVQLCCAVNEAGGSALGARQPTRQPTQGSRRGGAAPAGASDASAPPVPQQRREAHRRHGRQQAMEPGAGLVRRNDLRAGRLLDGWMDGWMQRGREYTACCCFCCLRSALCRRRVVEQPAALSSLCSVTL